MSDPSGAYVRLPLPPEIVAALAKYAELGAELGALMRKANASAVDFASVCARAAAQVQSDLAAVEARRARRRAR